MSVLLLQPSYPYVQVMVVGGGQDPESATTFQMINLSTLNPKWGPPVTLPDGLSRVNVNLVALPDGTVFVSGGRPDVGPPENGGARSERRRVGKGRGRTCKYRGASEH